MMLLLRRLGLASSHRRVGGRLRNRRRRWRRGLSHSHSLGSWRLLRDGCLLCGRPFRLSLSGRGGGGLGVLLRGGLRRRGHRGKGLVEGTKHCVGDEVALVHRLCHEEERVDEARRHRITSQSSVDLLRSVLLGNTKERNRARARVERERERRPKQRGGNQIKSNRREMGKRESCMCSKGRGRGTDHDEDPILVHSMHIDGRYVNSAVLKALSKDLRADILSTSVRSGGRPRPCKRPKEDYKQSRESRALEIN